MDRWEKQTDIRDKKSLSGQEIMNLNFIKGDGLYRFRKFYRSGLRSHIFEVLSHEAMKRELSGIVKDGVKFFPRARPKKIFRIFRNRFSETGQIFDEIKKYKILLNRLGPEMIARSEEFIVDYTHNGKRHILLCGLQEYIDGEILDPWKIVDSKFLENLFYTTYKVGNNTDQIIARTRKNIRLFTKRIRKMILTDRYIPDLAGVGNLVLTPAGSIQLVDINNIVPVEFNGIVSVDDRGYPSCDVSVHVLFILEELLLSHPPGKEDPLYREFMSPRRKKEVKSLERKFYERLK